MRPSTTHSHQPRKSPILQHVMSTSANETQSSTGLAQPFKSAGNGTKPCSKPPAAKRQPAHLGKIWSAVTITSKKYTTTPMVTRLRVGGRAQLVGLRPDQEREALRPQPRHGRQARVLTATRRSTSRTSCRRRATRPRQSSGTPTPTRTRATTKRT